MDKIDELLQDESRINNVARDLEIKIREGESFESFRYRVSFAHLKKYGDALEATGLLSGKGDYHDFDESENAFAFALFIAHNESKDLVLEAEGDTFFHMSWDYYLEVLKKQGFRKVYSEEVSDIGRGSKEEFCLWFHDKKAILLEAESWDNKAVVNSTQIYYEVLFPKDPDQLDESYHGAFFETFLRHSSNGPIQDKNGNYIGRSFRLDAREGLVSHLDKIEKMGFKTSNPWRSFKDQFIYLVNYAEEKKSKGYRKSKSISLRKLLELPQDVKDKIGLTREEIFSQYVDTVSSKWVREWVTKSGTEGKWYYFNHDAKGILGKCLAVFNYLLPL